MAMAQSSPCPPKSNAFGYQHDESSTCSIRSAGSDGTVRHHRLRSLSGSSLSSLTSLWAPPFRRQENKSMSGSASSSNLTFRRNPSTQRSTSRSYSRRASVTSMLSSRLRLGMIEEPDLSGQGLLDVAENDGEIPGVGEDDQSLAGDQPALSFDGGDELPTLKLDLGTYSDKDTDEPHPPEPAGIKRWLSTLRRRKRARNSPLTSANPRVKPNDGHVLLSSPMKQHSAHHKPSDSQGSSLAFVSAVRSATATIASFSINTVSHRNTRWRRGHQRSSIVSGSDLRPSIDSQRSAVDEAAKHRARKRRQKLEELIRSEEGYLADIRALSRAYTTIIGSQPSTGHFARSRAQKNIFDISTLHDELLGTLHAVIPFAEYDLRSSKISPTGTLMNSHARWHSVDVVPTRSPPTNRKLTAIRQGRRSLNISRSSADDHPTLSCSPQIVGLVAKAFSAYIGRLAVYEEYATSYELVQRDIEETQRTLATWPDFDRAVEVLSAHVNPVKSREANRKKALTVKDLLIKPIQRLPRYELIFSDICKLTPVCDSPDSHAAVQDLLMELHEMCRRLNAVLDNPERARMLETTYLLGDRLTFSNQVPRSVFLQLLGQVHMCGCLYVAYRSRDRIKGLYAVCVLFGSTLLLATAEEDHKRYSTIAGISLANASIVEIDNGKGLQCYTAPHSWKLVFEHTARMFEVIVVACSADEAEVWRKCIGQRIEIQSKAVADGTSNVFDLHSPLIAEMRSVGKAFGKPGSFIRRMSVHRTATVGPTADLNQVIVKNTQSAKEAIDNGSTASLHIPRSQSVATPSHVQTLAPRRAERVRLESLLFDVWTKDLLQYPGMTPRRSDPIRASANHVIRKFSMASITSNFSYSKRSASYTRMSQSRKEEMPPPRSRPPLPPPSQRMEPPRVSGPPLVDFHNAPEAFLPADFELPDPNAKRKKSALRTFTMSIERPFSPLLGNENKPSALRRAQSVRDIGGSRPSPPMPPARVVEQKQARPVYSVVQEHSKTPAPEIQTLSSNPETYKGREEPAKTPRKSKSRLLRLFG